MRILRNAKNVQFTIERPGKPSPLLFTVILASMIAGIATAVAQEVVHCRNAILVVVQANAHTGANQRFQDCRLGGYVKLTGQQKLTDVKHSTTFPSS